MKAFEFVVAASAALATISPTAPQIAVGSNTHVSRARTTDAHYELIANAHPTDPHRLIACAMVWSSTRQSTVVYVSSDGGATWRTTLQPDDIERTFDPVCTFGPDGTAYFVALASYANRRGETLVYRSPDGGHTWEPPVRLPILDREYLAFDGTPGKFAGRGYIHGTGGTRSIDGDRPSADDVTLFRSVDGFKTFAGPVARTALGRAYVLGMGTSVVLSDGSLVALFGEVSEYWQANGRGEVPPNRPGHPNAVLKVIRSVDGGESWLPASSVSDWYMERAPWGSYGIPVLALDPGSVAFKDRLYAAWVDSRSGRLAILLATSADRGEHWSAPILVNDDRAAVPPANGPDDITPVVAVNKDGVLGVVWADRRDHADNLSHDTRFAASLDGGETFQPSVKVSSVSTTFGQHEAWPVVSTVSGGGTRRSGTQEIAGTRPIAIDLDLQHFFFGEGHTAGMAVDSDGVFHPVWIDNRTGVAQLWTARVSVRGMVARNGSADLSDMHDVTSDVTLELTDTAYDRTIQQATVMARLKNSSASPIRGPVIVRVVGLRSDVALLQIVNADNHTRDAGAVWDFTTSLKNGVLGPGEYSGDKPLVFRLSEIRPFKQGDSYRFGLVHVDARVLAKTAAATP
jgi:hypothetical protein